MDRATLIKQAILAAGDVVRKAKIDAGIVEKEGRANFATAADLASEKTIVDHIKKHFPEDEILSEESYEDVADPLSLNHLWIIDPIDGTNNFRYDRAFSAISIGYAERGELQVGAIYDFNRNLLYFSQKGKGAFLQDQPIHVSEQTDITQAMISTDNAYDSKDARRNLELTLKIEPTPWVMVRGSAVLAMADIAIGRNDVYFHTAVKPWDNAAGFLLVQEAGGTIIGIDGKPVDFLTSNFVMGNKTLVEQTVKFFNNHE